jgi:hypothetical protein
LHRKNLLVGRRLGPGQFVQDADGSGTLQMAELLHGLLKIRGEGAEERSRQMESFKEA